ncbi:MAG TPA: FAD-dependent oxidoreductase [Noviherbaspirillum sp.]
MTDPQSEYQEEGRPLTDSSIFSASRRSIWNHTADEFTFAPLAADLDVEVAIIGGGMTGITVAAMLERTGYRVAVLEAARIGYGTTGHATGNLYAPVGQYLHKLAEKWGWDVAGQVVRSRRMAIDLIERNVTEHHIRCQFLRHPWVLYSADASPAEDDIIEREYHAASRLGLDAHVTTDIPLPYSVKKALVVSHQAQFDPLRYVRQLAAAIRSGHCHIFEGTPVTGIDEAHGIVSTAQHRVTARHIVMATHTPKGFNTLQTGLGPYREYAVAATLAEKQLAGGIFWSVGPERYSTRLVEFDDRPRVLMIGEMHKTGQREDTVEIYRKLERILRARFDVVSVDYRWSAQQYRPADGLPYIGTAIGAPHLYVATGFAADGLTYGALAGFMLAEQIAGRHTEFDSLYSPHRFTPVKSAGKFLKENLNVAGYYVKDYLKGGEARQLDEVRVGEGRVIEIGGDKLAVYRDDANQLHAVSPVCTHLKCIVHWNRAERTWDCPCHGSRFSYDGDVLEGPALAPLERRAVANASKTPPQD